jgi:uncharacterized membrane protein
MPATLLFFEFSRTAAAMSFAGIVFFLIALWAVKSDFAQAAGLDKIAVLANLCFAIPLAVFGAEHFSAASGISQGVPKYMPWPLFWTYLVGVALVAASLSIATRVQVRWSGLLFGLMMFAFVSMMDIPGAFARHFDRISVALLLRELSFGGAGWVLAGAAIGGSSWPGKTLINVGRILIAFAAIFYGVEHFLHPLGMPGVPLQKEMPLWIPARMLIGYLTGVFLLIGGVCFLLGQKTRTAAIYLGGWIVLLVVIIYGPVMIGALLDPSTAVKVEGLNYFFDTLLFGGEVLALAVASPAPAEVLSQATSQPQPI